MKSIATTIAALFAVHYAASAQSAPGLPKDAETLRKSYLEAKQRAMQPLDNKYKAELEKILAAHTKAGHLDEAISIRAEIATISTTSSVTLGTAAIELNSGIPAIESGSWYWCVSNYAYVKAITRKDENRFATVWHTGTMIQKGTKVFVVLELASGKKLPETILTWSRKDDAFIGGRDEKNNACMISKHREKPEPKK